MLSILITSTNNIIGFPNKIKDSIMIKKIMTEMMKLLDQIKIGFEMSRLQSGKWYDTIL